MIHHEVYHSYINQDTSNQAACCAKLCPFITVVGQSTSNQLQAGRDNIRWAVSLFRDDLIASLSSSRSISYFLFPFSKQDVTTAPKKATMISSLFAAAVAQSLLLIIVHSRQARCYEDAYPGRTGSTCRVKLSQARPAELLNIQYRQC